ncbi:MAG: Gfo/Idh/MocA family protein [Christensenellales bacterium]|jgi:predicted dehydrogenase
MSGIWTLGVLGLGEGRSIMSAALSSKSWRLGNICDLNEELCKSRRDEFGFDRYTTRYEDMLEDPAIDVIGIYTPDQLHALHIKMALKAGKHVICTKPLLVDLEEANDLLKVQKETGKSVFVGQSSRYFESAMQQRKDYEAGKLGELITLETHYISDSRWFLDKGWSHQKGFSWMYNFLVHPVDLAVWYLGDVQSVYAAGVTSANTKSRGIDSPDAMKVLLTNSDGLCASVNGVYASPSLPGNVQQSISCTLRGTKGVCLGGSNLSYVYKFDENGNEAHELDLSDRWGYYYRFEGATHHAGEYQNYIEDFAAEMNAGRAAKPDLREGIRTIAVMEAIKESMSYGRAVKVQDVLDKNNIELF